MIMLLFICAQFYIYSIPELGIEFSRLPEVFTVTKVLELNEFESMHSRSALIAP